MNLTGKQIEQVRNALLSGYPDKTDLRMLVRIELDENLAAIADGENLRVVVFNLVTWAEQTGRIDDVIQGAYRQNPGNPDLKQLAQDAAGWGAPAPSTLPAKPAGPASIDVFLSYSRQDAAAMRAVQSVLRDAGFAVWTDEGLEPGTPSWQAAIAEAIGQSQALVVLLSPSANASVWVNNEVSFAQMHGKRIFTMLVAGEPTTAVPISLISVQRVDGRHGVRSATVDGLRPALARQLGRGPEAPSTAIPFDWVTIPAGEFLMGSDKAKDSQTRDNETPQHWYYLPEFRISRVPVTKAQYMEFVTATGGHTEPPDDWTYGRISYGKAQHPVVYVSWHDAQAFCKWAGVRLPTEAEWEKAARGTDGRIWPWGNAPPTKELCNFNSNVGNTTPVGRYPLGASPYGVLDMAGNVWEWTTTKWTSSYQNYQPDDEPEDDALLMLRGGAFYENDLAVRCATRFENLSDLVAEGIGFRCVVLSPSTSAL